MIDIDKLLNPPLPEMQTVYVCRSWSSNEFIASRRNFIHKIGVTAYFPSLRIADAKNEKTFLYADAELMRWYNSFNVNGVSLETALHKVFSGQKLSPHQLGYNVDEWFFVPLEAIDEAIAKLNDGTIGTNHRYDSETGVFETIFSRLLSLVNSNRKYINNKIV